MGAASLPARAGQGGTDRLDEAGVRAMAEAGTVDGTAPRKAMGYRIRDRSQATVFPRTFRSGES